METAPYSQTQPPDLQSMIATLCSYENCFGPYHPHTLRLMTEVALALWQHGDVPRARPILERAARDCGRYLGCDCDARLRALAALRDLLVRQGDYQRAAGIQRDLAESTARRLGEAHPQALASRDEAEVLLRAASASGSSMIH